LREKEVALVVVQERVEVFPAWMERGDAERVQEGVGGGWVTVTDVEQVT
jgi:hypothetical protein